MILAVSQTTINLAYLVAGVCLIVGIKRLSSPATARSGNVVAAVGMTIAVVFTLLSPEIDSYWLIAAGIAVGTVIGVASARMVKMTAMPQMVALFNGVGGGAAALIAAAEFHRLTPAAGHVLPEHMGAMLFSALIGSISFSGSLIAFGKLQELLPGRPIVFAGQQIANAHPLRRSRRRRDPGRRDRVRDLGDRAACSARSCSASCSCSPSAERTCPS